MAPIMALSRFDVADLELEPDEEGYSEGVACVKAYWAYALDMTPEDRRAYCALVADQEFMHSEASRYHPSLHTLYEDGTGKTIPGLLIIEALYKTVPKELREEIKSRGLVIPERNRTEEYIEQFPDTPVPPSFDFDTDEARDYASKYPNLAVIRSIYRRKEVPQCDRNDKLSFPPTPTTKPVPVPSTAPPNAYTLTPTRQYNEAALFEPSTKAGLIAKERTADASTQTPGLQVLDEMSATIRKNTPVSLPQATAASTITDLSAQIWGQRRIFDNFFGAEVNESDVATTPLPNVPSTNHLMQIQPSVTPSSEQQQAMQQPVPTPSAEQPIPSIDRTTEMALRREIAEHRQWMAECQRLITRDILLIWELQEARRRAPQ